MRAALPFTSRQAGALLILLALTPPLGASVLTESNSFLTRNGIYANDPFITCVYPAPGATLRSWSMVNPTGAGASNPPPGPGMSTDSFFDVFIELELDMGSGFNTHDTTGSGQARITNTGGGSGGSSGTGTFETEMLQMQLHGGTMPAGVRLRASTTQPSTGTTTIQPGPTSGTFLIDSFFDVFTEISLDDGQTWHPGQNAVRLALTGITPEPSAAALLSMTAFAAGLGRRRRAIKRPPCARAWARAS